MKYFRRVKPYRLTLAIAGTLSLLWFIYRTGTKPTRIRYPCQRVALAQSQIFFVLMIAPFLGALISYISSKKNALLLISLISLGAVGTIPSVDVSDSMRVSQSVILDLQPRLSIANSSVSDVFFINNASGPKGNIDLAMQKLIDLMGDSGLFFYSTSENPSGLFGKNDVIIIKINCQSDRRGGTNTDLLKSVIQKIVDHPDGFNGEIVVADNGQSIGWLDWYETNSFDSRQSAQDVVDLFSPSYKVSTYLWDTIWDVVVSEYDSGDLNDGYVVDPEPDPTTGMRVSYPKFRTAFGTYISMRKGVWNVNTGTYDSAKLKVINTQVLKSHELYGVTGCVKNYMGVLSQFLSDGHRLIGKGAMGTEMSKTRFPTLNILDCIWVNANPIEVGNAPPCGPVTPYEDASYTNVIAASVDPMALDYLASKYVLMPAALARGYKEVSSLDPDNPNRVAGLWESFHNYLKRSMEQLKLAGFQATMNESEMNMFVNEYIPKTRQGNLIISDDVTTTIEGRFDINGSIIIEENATLYLKNAVINFRQMANGQHNMTLRNPLRGKPHLRVENATIASNYVLPVYLYSSSATIVELNAANLVELRSYDNSNVSISDSILDSLHFWDSSIVTLSNSIVRNLWCSELSDVTVSNCTIRWLSGLNSSKVKALNSIIKDELNVMDQCIVWLVNSTSTRYNLSRGGVIYIYWYLNVHAVDSEGTDFPYVNVTAIFRNATVAESELADTQGWAKLTLMERLMNASGSHPVANYTVTAKYETYEGQESRKITGNQQITIILSCSQRIKPEPFPILLPLLLAPIFIVIAVALRKLLRFHSQRYRN